MSLRRLAPQAHENDNYSTWCVDYVLTRDPVQVFNQLIPFHQSAFLKTLDSHRVVGKLILTDNHDIGGTGSVGPLHLCLEAAVSVAHLGFNTCTAYLCHH